MAYSGEQNFLVSFGGMDENIKYFGDVWVFNFTSSTWRELISTSDVVPGKAYSVARISTGCFVDHVKHYFYIFGGESSLGFLKDMWKFDLEDYSVSTM